MDRILLNNGRFIYVTQTSDVGENKGGLYCEVYLDPELDDWYDFFVVHPDEEYEEVLKGFILNSPSLAR